MSKNSANNNCTILVQKDIPLTYFLINICYNKLFKENEKEIFKNLLSLSNTNIYRLLENFDIETFSDNKILILANFIELHPEFNLKNLFADKIRKTKDLYMQNKLRLLVHMEKIVKEFNQINIKPMLLKGALMNYLNPDFIRTMGDIDILIPEQAFNYSLKIAKKLDYDYQQEPHSFDFHEKNSELGTIDIHKYIYMDTKSETALNKGIWDRAKQIKFLDLDLCIPAFEDSLFISLINTARNLRNGTSIASVLYSFFDCKYLIENKLDFNWKIVFDNADATKTKIHLLFSLLFIKELMPDLLKEDLIKISEEEKQQLEEYSLKVLYNRFFIDELRQKSRKNKFKNIFQSRDKFIQFFKVNLKYFLLKNIRNSTFAIKQVMLKSNFLKDL